MLVSIINGIVHKLFDQYGEDYAIYTDFVEQDFNEPCFYIHVVDSSSNRELYNRYKRSYSFDIVYFPKKENCIDELGEISEQLYLELEMISVDGNLVTGTEMKHHIQDGVLHFLVDYRLMIEKIEQKESEMMMELEWKGRIKDGAGKTTK